MALVACAALAACMPIPAAYAAQAAAATPYEWHLPPGFPQPLTPQDNPMSDEKVELGRQLFFDTRLSSTGRFSCASCHQPDRAFTDGRAHAQGATGDIVKHSAMTLTNVAYNIGFTWADNHVHSLEAQMRQPLFSTHPLEMGLLADGASTVKLLSGDGRYRAQFAAAFPADPAPLTMSHIIKAIACFERTLLSGRSPFDRYLYDDDRSAISEPAKRGMALFFSERIGCAQCHSGINFSGPIRYVRHERAHALFANNGLSSLDQGLIEVTHRPEDRGKYRVPTLRNIALTAPYMHDGSLPTLDDVLDHYARVRALALSSAERSELLAFLASLTDRDFVENPAHAAPNQP